MILRGIAILAADFFKLLRFLTSTMSLSPRERRMSNGVFPRLLLLSIAESRIRQSL